MNVNNYINGLVTSIDYIYENLKLVILIKYYIKKFFWYNMFSILKKIKILNINYERKSEEELYKEKRKLLFRDENNFTKNCKSNNKIFYVKNK